MVALIACRTRPGAPCADGCDGGCVPGAYCGAAPGGTSRGCECVVPKRPYAPELLGRLSAGFDVQPLITHHDARAGVVTWDPLPNARIVHCVVLMCAPVVTGEGEQATISNYRECVRGWATFEPPLGPFSIASAAPTGDDGHDRVPSEYGPFVACWAYDGTRIIAASDLIPVTVGELPVERADPYTLPCDPDSRGPTATQLCAADDGSLGVCAVGPRGWQCVSRCLAGSARHDCPAAPPGQLPYQCDTRGRDRGLGVCTVARDGGT